MLRPVLVLALLIEGVTCLARFGLGLESTRDTASLLAPLTGGWRIHHGMVGAVLLPVFWLARREWPWRRRLLILAWALFLSDVVHHWLVLWPITGSPQFDLRYPVPGTGTGVSR
jgi:hypothetical protein